MRVTRIDRTAPKILRSPERRDNGTLAAEGIFTRAGVFTYRNPNGSLRYEYRDPSEVFNPASMASFKLIPVTDDHPASLIDATNARDVACGSTGNDIERVDGDLMKGSIGVHDASLVAKMERGIAALSCGYTCDLIEAPGIAPDGTRYDARQINIRGNHLAVVPVARAGAEARARMDGALESVSDDDIPASGAENNINHTHFSGAIPMNLEQALAALAAAHVKIGEMTAAGAADKTRADKAEARADKAEAEALVLAKRAETAEQARLDAATIAPEVIAARVALETTAHAVLGAGTDGKPRRFDSMTDRAIKIAIVKAVDGVDISPDPKVRADAFVDGAFELASARAVAGDRALGSLNADTDRSRTDAATMDGAARADAARDKMIERNRNAYKPTAPAKA